MAYISVQAMREALLKRYPSGYWKQRVLKMTDNQVMAIYERMIKTGEIK